jgi:molybdopterin-containing oxidoreductase family iron-sulfur binding subunit
MTVHEEPFDLSQAGEQLRNASGKEYWRSLEELSQSERFRELVEREFPHQLDALADPISRRRFLVLMGASLALAGLSGCLPSPAPPERILPYVRTPEGTTLGRPRFFATAMSLAGDVQGLLIESHEGRPTKVEGNPDHPANPVPSDNPSPPEKHIRFGPTDAFAQASLHTLYDPDRSQSVTNLGNISTWDGFVNALRTKVREAGTRIRILTETVVSPTLAHQLRIVLPAVKWHRYEPVGTENARAGARLAFAEDLQVRYSVDKADVILALDADFLSVGPGHVRHVRDFSDRRRVRQERGRPGSPARPQHELGGNRLYVVESTPSNTGAMADHRLPLRSCDVEALARALAGRLDASFRPIAGPLVELGPPLVPNGWLDALAKDLQQHRGKSLIVVGESQPPFVHALAHALNHFLGNTGETVEYMAPVEAEPSSTRPFSVASTLGLLASSSGQGPLLAASALGAGKPGGSLRELAEDMEHGLVDVLLVFGGNPVYTAPADLRLAERMERVPFRAHLGLYEDETSAECHWHIPEAHYLESWSDLRSPDGTVSIVQPLIAPLFGGKTTSECLALLTDQPERSSYDIVRAYWRSVAGGQKSEAWWRRALHDGKAAKTSMPPRHLPLRSTWMQAANPPRSSSTDDLEIVFRPDPTIFDGRFANNGWLQELPKPLSKLTWDNAAYLSPATAIRLGFASEGHSEEANEKVVDLEYQGQKVSAPLWVLPGHADNSITVHLGYGRTRAGKVGTGLGFNANKLRTASAPWFGVGLKLHATTRRAQLAGTQHHFLMESRDLVRSGTLQHPPTGPAPPRRSLTMYNDTDHPHEGEQWGMVIDLNVCTGCSACVVACQSENNIPIVGKEEVKRGREMHWIRIDRYYKGSAANPEMYSQPVPCMHCENAPCELVCPVGATVHSSDGLNDMVYNRCVGTRYCSNNCPYKVRRFNFFQFADFDTEIARLGRNPEVTVRSRGVMEKCTYCVQRIRTTQINAQTDAQREDRSIRDGEIQTACQAVCPAGAIIFGNINGKGADGRPSKVAQLKSEPLHYDLLAELNTRPRTTYLAAVKNPNPEMPVEVR